MAKETRSEQSYDWLQSLCSGDEIAFAELIDKYKETVFLCCRGLGLKADEAEDVANEVFLAAYRGLGRYRRQAELSTWLWSIAYRQAVSFLRKNRRKCPRLHGGEPVEQLADREQREPVSKAQESEDAEIVWAAVRRLPKLWAMAVILHYREEKSITDIANIMEVKKNTVKTYLFRGREKLKSALSEINVNRSAKR